MCGTRLIKGERTLGVGAEYSYVCFAFFVGRGAELHVATSKSPYYFVLTTLWAPDHLLTCK